MKVYYWKEWIVSSALLLCKYCPSECCVPGERPARSVPHSTRSDERRGSLALNLSFLLLMLIQSFNPITSICALLAEVPTCKSLNSPNILSGPTGTMWCD